MMVRVLREVMRCARPRSLSMMEAASEMGLRVPDDLSVVGFDNIPETAYCKPRFLELETLGPRTTLAPGESVGHHEMWVIRDGVSARDIPDLAGEILK